MAIARRLAHESDDVVGAGEPPDVEDVGNDHEAVITGRLDGPVDVVDQLAGVPSALVWPPGSLIRHQAASISPLP